MPLPGAHALIVGVGSYANRPEHDVASTVEDAAALAEVLADPRHCGYPPGNVTLLQDEGATRGAILAALDALAARAAGDTVLFFFSGHGLSYEGTYFLPTHDTRYVDGRPTADSMIQEQELLAKLRAVPAKRLLLIFNTCHAGAVSPTLGDAAPETGAPLPAETGAALLGTGEGRIIITACREQQFSYVGPGPGTIVGRALVGALRGEGLAGGSGPISAYELYLTIYRRVGELVRAEVPPAVRKTYGETQEPELTVLKGVGPFAVALRQGAPALGDLPAEPPPAAGAVRQVSAEESRQALQTIISRGVSFGQGNTVTVGGDVVGGDQHRTVVRGDYVGGSVDSRQGVWVDGGSTVVGSTVTGVVSGNLTIGGAGAASAADVALALAVAQAQQAVAAARQRGDDDLADDLDAAAGALRAALKAQAEGKAERRAAKIAEAAESVRRLAADHPELGALAAAVAGLG